MRGTQKAIARGVAHGVYLATSSDPTKLRALAKNARNSNVTVDGHQVHRGQHPDRPDLDHDGQDEQVTRQLVTEQYYARSAPVPTPEELAGYEQILPGAADRILTMAEDAQAAYIEAMIVPIRAEAYSIKFATVAFSLLPFGAFTAAGTLAVLGQPTVAIISAAAGLLSVGPRLIRAIKASPDTPSVEDLDGE